MADKDGKDGRFEPGKSGNPNGRPKRTPEEYMKQLVPARPRIDHDDEAEEAEAVDGEPYNYREDWIDPVEFCQAVINADPEVLSRIGIRKPPSITQRLDAARIAIPYTNKRKPVEINNKHDVSWVDEIREAEERLSSRVDVEDIEVAYERTEETD